MLDDHHAIGPTGLDPPRGASNRRKANSSKRPLRGAITNGTILKFFTGEFKFIKHFRDIEALK